MMKTNHRTTLSHRMITCLAGLGMLLWCGLSQGASNPTTDKLIEEIASATPNFSGAVYYEHEGKENWFYFGKMGPDDDAPDISPETSFATASLGKHITSYMVIELIRQGKLMFNSKLGQLFELKSEDPNVKNITVSQLMNHTSGFGQQRCSVAADINDMLDCARIDPDKINEHDYSNFGYLLLGKVIETVTGKTYTQAFTEMILDPLNLKGSGYTRTDKTAKGMMTTPIGKIATDDFMHHSVVYPDDEIADGGHIFTLPDLVAWLRFMRDGSKNEFYLRALKGSHKGPYRYGWREVRELETPYDWHNGAVPGFTSAAYWNAGTMLVILQNTDRAAGIAIDEAVLAAVVERCTTAEQCIGMQSEKSQKKSRFWQIFAMMGNPIICWLVVLGYSGYRVYSEQNRLYMALKALGGIVAAWLFALWRLDNTLGVVTTAVIIGIAIWKWPRTGIERTKYYYVNVLVEIAATVVLAIAVVGLLQM